MLYAFKMVVNHPHFEIFIFSLTTLMKHYPLHGDDSIDPFNKNEMQWYMASQYELYPYRIDS